MSAFRLLRRPELRAISAPLMRFGHDRQSLISIFRPACPAGTVTT
jgi:hypothetical protein